MTMSGSRVTNSLSPALGNDIQIAKLSHIIADRLREQIISGQFEPGSLLLPENQLLSLFNVSRPTLREALRILEAEALISIGRGMRSGATVLGPSLNKAAEYTTAVMISEGVTIRDLHEARLFFEPAIIESLAEPSLSGTAKALRAYVKDMEAALADGRTLDAMKTIHRFHEEIARASSNKTIALLVQMVQIISDDGQTLVLSAVELASEDALFKNMSKVVVSLAKFCAILEQGKTAEAAAAWRTYMKTSLDLLNRSKIGDQRLSRLPAA